MKEGFVDSFNNKKIINISKGGYTVKRIIKDYKKEIEKAEQIIRRL